MERVRASLAAAPPVTGSRAVLRRVSPDRTTALLIVNLNPRGEETLLKSSVGQVANRKPAVAADDGHRNRPRAAPPWSPTRGVDGGGIGRRATRQYPVLWSAPASRDRDGTGHTCAGCR